MYMYIYIYIYILYGSGGHARPLAQAQAGSNFSQVRNLAYLLKKGTIKGTKKGYFIFFP